MEHTYWQKQTPENPLFPDLLWSRPQNKYSAGKLLIIGGNSLGFNDPADAYDQAQKTKAGTIRILLPDKSKKLIGHFIESGTYAPSTPSGSFAKISLSTWLEESDWSDLTLLAGDFSKNSETAILLASFLQKTTSLVALSGDSLEPFINSPKDVLKRPNTLVVATLSQLQQIVKNLPDTDPVTSSMSTMALSEKLHDLTARYKASLITAHDNTVFVGHNGMVSTTPLDQDTRWQVKVATSASIWWMQNPTKPFQALTSSLL